MTIVNPHALINCGVTGIVFIDKDFACHHQIKEKQLKESKEIEVINERPIEWGTITTMVKLNLGIQGHQELLPVFVTKLDHYSMVLGLPWFQHHDITIQFQNDSIGSKNSYCQ